MSDQQEQPDGNSDQAVAIARIRQWRKRQIQLVALGTMAFLVSLVGGALRSPWLARSGAALFLLCLALILVLGLLSMRHQPSDGKPTD